MNHKPFTTTTRERELNDENGLRSMAIVVVIGGVLLMAVCIGVYFGLFMGKVLAGG